MERIVQTTSIALNGLIVLRKNFNNLPGQYLAISLLRKQGHHLLDLAGGEDVAEVDELLVAAV